MEEDLWLRSQDPCSRALSSARWNQSTCFHPFSLRSTSIFFNLCTCFLSGWLCSRFPTKFFISSTLAAYTTHLTLLEAPRYRIFSTFHFVSYLLGLNILRSNLFSNTLSLFSSFKVRDRDSNPDINKIIVLYVLIFRSMYVCVIRRKDKILWTEWYHTYLNVILLVYSLFPGSSKKCGPFMTNDYSVLFIWHLSLYFITNVTVEMRFLASLSALSLEDQELLFFWHYP